LVPDRLLLLDGLPRLLADPALSASSGHAFGETLPLTASDVPAAMAKLMQGQEGMFRQPEEQRPSKIPKVSSQMVTWQIQAMLLLRKMDRTNAMEVEAAVAALPSADEMMDEHLADKRPTYIRAGWANACELTCPLSSMRLAFLLRHTRIHGRLHIHCTLHVAHFCWQSLRVYYDIVALSQSCWWLRFMLQEVNTSCPSAFWRRSCGRIWMPSRRRADQR
jgi:hypothetical protein